jgi:hypothetical protein
VESVIHRLVTIVQSNLRGQGKGQGDGSTGTGIKQKP